MMMQFLAVTTVLLLSTTIVVARPSSSNDDNALTEAEFTNLELTVEHFDKILKAYEVYKEFIPDYVYNPLQSLTTEQKQDIVKAMNDYRQGKFDPKNFQELLAIIQKDYPSVALITEQMYRTYQEHVQLLGPKAQEFVAQNEAQLYEAANPDRIVWACNLFNKMQSILKQVNELLEDNEESAKIDAAFPEAVKFLHSNEFKAYSTVIANLKTLDCQKDREQVFNTVKLFDEYNVLTKKD